MHFVKFWVEKCIYFALFGVFLKLYIKVSVPRRACIIKMWMYEGIASHSLKPNCQKTIFFGKETSIFHLFFIKAIGSPGIVSSITQPR